MKFRLLTLVIISCLLWITSWLFAPSASALTQVKLYDLSYEDCPPEFAQGNVTSGGNSFPANCYMITGKADNPSFKTVYDASVYGRILDAYNNPVLENRTRLGQVEEIPPGISDFELRVTVPANQPLPLQLKQFKASGFPTSVRLSF